MKNTQKTLVRLAAILPAVALAVCTAQAQTQVYSQDFETDTTADWLVNMTGDGYNYADFYFDYSTVGVPPAPNSGGTTRGLKLGANLGVSTIFPAGISVSPLGFGITENFEMHFDIWLNYVKSGVGSTELGGAGYGTAGTTAQVAGVADSIFISASTDGGTLSDYRVYAPDRQISYQDADTVIRTDPTTPLVYAAGSRNSAASYYLTNFPGNLVFPASPVPAAQTNLFPRQTEAIAPAGSAGFRWHDATLKKVANTVTYSIDGLLIATVDIRDAASGGLGGTNILFNFYDINAGGSTDVDSTNLQFALFDNVRITNFANVVSVDTATPTISESGLTPGVFTITRTSAGVPLTVNYTISGSASNGVDFVSIAGSVEFQPSDTTTNISVTPIGDSIAETTEQVVLTIEPSPNYTGAGSAIINITDDESPQLAITTVFSQSYERSLDYARYRITRLGDLNANPFIANVTFSGTATLDTDYFADPAVTFNPGDSSLTFDVHPIDDTALEGDETIIATIAPATGGEYTIAVTNSATATLVDAATPEETVLFSDNFDIDTTTDWNLLFAAAPDATPDYIAMFNYDYASFNGIPAAPHSNGDTHGLYLTVNKNDPTTAAAALNLYPLGKSFSGNYALRFDMFLINGGGTASTEYALFGVNHSGNKTNWFRNSPGGVGAGWSFDGIFYDIEADGTANGDYVSYSSPTTAENNPTALSSTNASALTEVFKAPPWAVAGAPSNLQGTVTPIWAEVEVSQVNNVLTLKVNNTVILSSANSTTHTNGNIMIGYEDAYDSIGPASSAVIYDNVRVVSLPSTAQPPSITGIHLINGGNQVQIDFAGGGGDTTASFKLQSSPNVNTGYTDDNAALISSPSAGTFRFVTGVSGTTQFYRIRHL